MAKRGFASMDPAKQREIASKGGNAAQATGRAHKFTPAEARAAGRKGGDRVMQTKGRAHMQTIGRKGGNANKGRLATPATIVPVEPATPVCGLTGAEVIS